MKAKPARTAFPDGVGGDKAWAKATREAASDFVLATRQASTAVEHVSYMLEWNDLLVEAGFGDHVVEAKTGDANSFTDGKRTIKAKLGKGRKAKVSQATASTRTVIAAHARCCDGRQRAWR